VLLVNFKIYKNTFGDGALKLAEICRRVGEKTKVKIIPVVSALDLRRVKEKVGGEIWLQHLDLFFEGKFTGWVSPIAVILAGADGALINHSEHQIPFGRVRQILAYLKKKEWVEHWVEELKELGDYRSDIENFKLAFCVKTKGQVERRVKKMTPKPDFVAYEPPELIGGTVSVAEAEPEVIKRIVDLLPDYKIIVGAGVRNGDDVEKSLELGAKGVLVSSDVVLAKDPKKELTELAEAFAGKVKIQKSPVLDEVETRSGNFKNANQR